ncbi:filamentous hemagglutinin N-terminal domain-containing protein, partial [Alcaligenes endophyticus]
MQQQQAAARAQLSHSLDNLNRTASAIAAQQAAQNAARLAAQQQASNVAEGLAQGGLEVAVGDKAQWLGAEAPVHTQQNGQHHVGIKQTNAKAILNWNRFDVGRNTTVEFQQKNTDAVLNRVVGDQVTPSQIQGRIKGDGTVMVVNQNGVVFSGTSQVNVRNLVAAAANISNEQFLKGGLYVNAEGSLATLTDALGKVEVQAGAQIQTHAPNRSVDGGGYVLLMGQEAHNAGQIHTPKGQAVLAAGDTFYIRKGQGTDGNAQSTTRGNEVVAHRKADSQAGLVSNSGLISAANGDITLTGHDVRQAGVLVATTSTSQRGTIHLSTRRSDADGRVTLESDSTTAILVDADSPTALDSQREVLMNSAGYGASTAIFDNLGQTPSPNALSRIDIVSGKTVDFQGNSLTLATGGEITTHAEHRSLLRRGAELDVAGQVGVRVAMDSNQLLINAQGNEQRDAPINRDSKNLNNKDIWVDRRLLVFVPKGTQGYESDRWYTAGGLLEVSGYLNTAPHTIDEWLAQGGTITATGKDFVSEAGSRLNLSGGTLDVQSGKINLSWLRGDDGRLYEASRAPSDLLYQGIHTGWESVHARWGSPATRIFKTPLLSPDYRYETGYTVGRDAGKLVLSTQNVLLRGDLIGEVYQGPRQILAAQAGLDGYLQSQAAVARRAGLIAGRLPHGDQSTLPLLKQIQIQEQNQSILADLDEQVSEDRQSILTLPSDWLNRSRLGKLELWAQQTINLDQALELAPGAELTLFAPSIDVNANIIAPSGTISAGFLGNNPAGNDLPADIERGLRVADGVSISAAGLLTDARRNSYQSDQQAYIDGGRITLETPDSLRLGQDSLLDVSAGAYVRDINKWQGGKGGSIRIAAGYLSPENSQARLELLGHVRGYGYTGAGTLDIDSRAALSIGGDLQIEDGWLQAGGRANGDLILLNDYEVKAGEILPVPYAIERTHTLPGEYIANPSGTYLFALQTFTTQSEWVIGPENGGANIKFDGLTYYYYGNSYGSNSYSYFNGTEFVDHKGPLVIPAGKAVEISYIDHLTVDPKVFPAGLKFRTPKKDILPIGATAPANFVVPKGTVFPTGTQLPRRIQTAKTSNIDLAPFNTGFAQYQLRGQNGVYIPRNIQIDLHRPIQHLNFVGANGQSQVQVNTILPPLFQVSADGRTVQQRAGASLRLTSGSTLSEWAAGEPRSLILEQGSSLRVDPGQAIRLNSTGDLWALGALHAPGGTIRLMGARELSVTGDIHSNKADKQAHQRQILIGEQAVLDASAAAWTGQNKLGHTLGAVSRGGDIIIGGEFLDNTTSAPSSDAFVVLRPGSRLDASGAEIYIDPEGRGAYALASHGGSITLGSSAGLSLHGSMTAKAGNAAAQGGRLNVLLDAPNYETANIHKDVLAPRELLVLNLQAAYTPDATLRYGRASLGLDQIDAGGFDDLLVYSGGLLGFTDNTRLAVKGQLHLVSGMLGLSAEAPQDSHIELSSQYLRLAGLSDLTVKDSHKRPTFNGVSMTPPTGTTRLTATVEHLDIQNTVNLGGTIGTFPTVGPDVKLRYNGFAHTDIMSSGDIRFLKQTATGTPLSQIVGDTNLTLQARQLYPDVDAKGGLQSNQSLTILRTPGSTPYAPYSLGELIFTAPRIQQHGVVLAPGGQITFRAQRVDNGGSLRFEAGDSSIDFGPGSITSISMAGLRLPYGGTVDGLDYLYHGALIRELASSLFDPSKSMHLSAHDIKVQEGAVLDLSGGGDLLGAGFVAGRGGSVDARLYPLMQVNRRGGGFTLPSLKSNPVYAIVPGHQAPYAPGGKGEGAVAPGLGQQITLEHGLPGLPAGTYTLLPSSYALLPGAFRVELNGAQAQTLSHAAPAPLRNGSWAMQGAVHSHQAAPQAGLMQPMIISSADTVRRYSQYNETSFSDFARQHAARSGNPRLPTPEDGKQLIVDLSGVGGSVIKPSPARSFSFKGEAKFEAAPQGYTGTVAIKSSSGHLHVVTSLDQPGLPADAARVDAASLNRLQAGRLALGQESRVSENRLMFHNSANVSDTHGLTIHSGTYLTAPEIVLAATTMTLEPGAVLSTLSQGPAPLGLEQGYYTQGHNFVLLSNNQHLAQSVTPSIHTVGSIRIGVCATEPCDGVTRLYSDANLTIGTNGSLDLSEQARYGTRHLSLATSSINVGSEQALDAARAQGILPAGLTLNQGILNRLLQGDTSWGAPALEQLSLTAGQSLNFWGNVALDTTDPATGRSRMERLVLRTPAIYGAGQAGEQAYLRTGDLYWTGLMQAAPAPMLGGAGHGQGTLRIDAEQFILGYDPFSRPNNTDRPERLTLGFDTVDVTARRAFTASHEGSLKVYQRWTGEDQNGSLYDGGHLLIRTPLLTGRSGSASHITAGGALRVQGLPGATADAFLAGMGSEIRLAAQQINVDTRVVLPSGQFQAHAQQDLILGPQASLNLAGKTTTFFDDEEATQYSWGGDITLASQHGNVILDAQSLIDVSAINNHAGYLTVQAPEGRVALQGRVLGGASGQYDAGGTWVPYRHAQLELLAKHLGLTGALSEQFALLNQRLDQGAVWGARQFQFGEGDLHIGGAVRAGQIGIALDRGHLTVDGLLDASGAQVGQIRLNAKHGLTLTGRAVLDAHGRLLRVDSYGQVIHSPNRAVVELNSGQGRLTLSRGARIDLRHGTDTPERDPEARSSLWLYAPRLDAADSGRMAVQADTGLDIAGACRIVLHAVQQYFDASAGTDAAASGRPYQVITQGWLDAKHTESTRFINNALANTGLIQNQLAGLTAYRDAFHLRPAVEILSATPDGDLVVQGDLDLSKYRYNSLNPHSPLTAVYGSGEAGALAIRAGGALAIYGSINDGFAPPPATPDDDGWVLVPGKQPFGGDVIVPIAGVKLEAGTQYPAGRALNFDLPAGNVTLPAGTRLPVDVTLDAAYTLPAGSVFRADVHAPDGSLLLPAGTPVPEGGLALPQNAKLGAGLHLPANLTVQNITWPKGVALPVAMNQAKQIDLPVGALLPADTDIKLADGLFRVPLRPLDGDRQAYNWALAPMLPSGSQSWNIRLVAGADTAAADPRSLRGDATHGSLVLGDTHYGMEKEYKAAGVWVWAPDNWMGEPAGQAVPAESLEYCEMDPSLCVLQAPPPQYVWAEGNWMGEPAGEAVPDESLEYCEIDPTLCTYVDTGKKELAGVHARQPNLSVLRTGTADLELAARHDLSMRSPYGIYTAGTPVLLGNGLDKQYDAERAITEDGKVLGNTAGNYENLVSGNDRASQNWYPDFGGNLSLRIQGDLTGDAWAATSPASGTSINSTDVHNWLWTQGNDGADTSRIPTAWALHFGDYVVNHDVPGTIKRWPRQVGFSGLGTLGGGNALVQIGGRTGITSIRAQSEPRSQGLTIAIASNGRVLPDGRVLIQGGGDLRLRLSGGWNPELDALQQRSSLPFNAHALLGGIVNLRGQIQLSAGQIGLMKQYYESNQRDSRDSRPHNPYQSSKTQSVGGLVLTLGDAAADIQSQRNLVLSAVADATRPSAPYARADSRGQGQTWFSLWTDHTAARAWSAGSHLTGDTRISEELNPGEGHALNPHRPSDGAFTLPGSVSLIATEGNIYQGTSMTRISSPLEAPLLLAPLGPRQLTILAGGSYFGGGQIIASSGAGSQSISTFLRPSYRVHSAGNPVGRNTPEETSFFTGDVLHAWSLNTIQNEVNYRPHPSTSTRVYSRDGDIIGLWLGAQIEHSLGDYMRTAAWYWSSGAAQIRAGQDIIWTGQRKDEAPRYLPVIYGSSPTGNFILHTHPNDVSTIIAGRDIRYLNLNVAGPGTVEITAGRNIIQEDKASIVSLGPVMAGDTRPGASIALQAGMNNSTYAGLLQQYLNPALRADAGKSLASQPGRVVHSYEGELMDWLRERYGVTFSGDDAVPSALAYFQALPAAQQRIFARDIYFTELR